MIAEGAFWQSVSEIKILANKLKLKKEVGKKRGTYSSSFLDIMHSDEYQKIYNCAIQNFDFEIMLIDESFFQFNFNSNSYSLAYFPRPTKFVDFEEWLSNMFTVNIDSNPAEFETFKQEMILDGDIHTEYEQYLTELESLQTIVPIRFDYDKDNYSEIYHPLCHFHIGLNNHIRIAFDKFITPLNFFHFILKNFFPDIFFYKDKNDCIKINEIILLKDRNKTVNVPADKFDKENLIIHFT